jgi:broad specificity phosphatase PhoE
MSVTLLRHYKVNYIWKKRYTPKEYRAALREYDGANIIDQKVELPSTYHQVIISSLQRTFQTMKLLMDDPPYRKTSFLDEVPIEPFTDKEKEYSLTFLTIMARVQWMLNIRRQSETRKRSVQRAKELIDKYLHGNGNYLIIGHGFFLRILSREMLRRGFIGRAITYIRNGEYYTYELPESG